MLLRTLAALLAGVLLSAAFEPLGLVLTAPLAVAVLACVTARSSARGALLPGLAFGVGFFFTLQWWMRAVGTDAWIGLSALEAVFLAPMAAMWAALQRRTRAWPLWLAVVWVAVETVRSSWPFSGMPWGRLSYAVADTPFAAGLPYYGFAGVSLLICLCGTSLAWLVLSRPRVPRALAVATVLLTLVIGPALLPWSSEVTSTVRVAVVQGDVPGAGDDLVSVHAEVTQNHVRATEELGARIDGGRSVRPDFVLWPENSTAVDPFDDVRTRSSIDRAVEAVDVPVLVGAMVDDADPERVLNQGIVWDPVTGPGERYSKWHPVPFGEYVPWRDLIFKQNLGRLQQIGRDMLGGTRTSPLRLGGATVADAICFDVAYDDAIQAQVAAGAELVVVQTSNAMFIKTHQIDQQFEITRLRALETGRAVAVAATNGVSGIIGPDAEVIDLAPVRTTTVLEADVPLSTSITPAVATGLWPGRLAVGLTILMLVLDLSGRAMAYIRRRPRSTDHPEEVL